MRLAFLLCLAAVSTAGALEPPPTFDSAVQDRAGFLWASSRSQNALHVYRFDGEQWEEQDLPSPRPQGKQAVLIRIVNMTDGAVASLWRLGDESLAVARHLGREPVRLLGTCAGRIKEDEFSPPLLADSKNRLWITGRFPQIYRADDRGIDLAHAIASEELATPKLAKQGYNELRAPFPAGKA